MTAILVAIFATFLIGLPIARSVDPRGDGLIIAGTSFLYGSGATFLVLLLLSGLGVTWSPVTVGAACVILFAIAVVLARRVAPSGARAAAPRLHGLDILTLATLVGYALYATLAPPWEIDFWAIWGLKGRAFLEAGGLDWHFLVSRWNVFQHPDYPMLLPFAFDFASLVNGSWDDRWMGLLYVAWAASLVLVVRSLASRESSPACAALIAFALAAPCVSRYIGLAEGALVAFGAASMLFLREALRTDEPAAWRHGALLLGFAANCKNEGVALLAAVTLAMAVAGPRAGLPSRVKRLWPAYALAGPWIAIRAFHALPTDLAGGGALARFVERLGHADSILALLASRLFQPWAWIALVAALLVIPAAAIIRERFVLAATVIQLFFFVAAYFATPYDVAWHVWASWPRLTSQLVVPVSFVVLLALVAVLSESPGTPPRGSPA